MFHSFMSRHWFDRSAVDIWNDENTVQAWLNVEVALASAQAKLGLIPPDVLPNIAEACRSDRLDFDRLSAGIAHAQHPFVPVLRQVEELAGDPAAGYIHWGATTQNIFDTATALQMKQSHSLLLGHLATLEDALQRMALAHRETVQAGRTHGQHALPMTFGFKVAGWLDELKRIRDRLVARIRPSFVVCLGGAIGTYAAMGDRGPDVALLVGRKLDLDVAFLPLRSSYDRQTDYFGALALLAQLAEKIGHDIVFMQRTEIGEVAEAFHHGKVGSSTMAQKRNPSTALLLISLCRMLHSRVTLASWSMPRMDEGDSSATNVTDIVVPELAVLSVSIAAKLKELCTGLVVDAERMKANIELTKGLILSEAIMMRLSDQMGRHHAHEMLYEATQRAAESGRALAEVMAEFAQDAKTIIDEVRVEGYTGSASRIARKVAET